MPLNEERAIKVKAGLELLAMKGCIENVKPLHFHRIKNSPENITAHLHFTGSKLDLDEFHRLVTLVPEFEPLRKNITLPSCFKPLASDAVLLLAGSLRAMPVNAAITGPDNVGALLASTDCKKERIGGENLKVLRFLVRKDGELFFGQEGVPDKQTTPAHTHLVSEEDQDIERACKTAGNAYFDDQNRMIYATNKSGDYRPPFNTLQFLIPALEKTKLAMATNVYFINQTTNDAYLIPIQSQFQAINPLASENSSNKILNALNANPVANHKVQSNSDLQLNSEALSHSESPHSSDKQLTQEVDSTEKNNVSETTSFKI